MSPFETTAELTTETIQEQWQAPWYGRFQKQRGQHNERYDLGRW